MMVFGSRLRSWLLVLAVLPPAGCDTRPRAAPEAPQAVRRLLDLMRDRLLLMHDVARSKWNSRRPVADPDREQALYRKMEERGREKNLDPATTRAFFTAQVEAAKQVQEADLKRWKAEGRGPFEDAPDLASLRRKIDRLNLDLLAALSEARPLFRDAAARQAVPGWARQAIAGEGLDDAIRTVAVGPLMEEVPSR